jgi:ATP-dependent RNA helicase DeaD
MDIKNNFRDFSLSPEVLSVIDTLGFVEPTEIQRRAIPLLLSAPRVDFHGQAQTGTGKTLAFGLPLLHRVAVDKKAVQALVVAPTRELALQICESVKPFAKAMGIVVEPIYGGVSMEEQVRRLRRGAHIVVGTPGRIIDHVNRGTLNLSGVNTLVLDEADIMLDMGFREEVDEILKTIPKNREIWLFSATVKQGIDDIIRDHMTNVESVRVSKKQVGATTTKHYYCVVPHSGRVTALCRFIESAPDFYGFVFCQTKILASEVCDQLTRKGYAVGSLHGDMSQAQRNMVIKKFREKDVTIVVATDVAARGIDVAGLTHVINFSLPEDHESYLHRSGRTGRAGREGVAITFVNRHDVRNIKFIERKFAVTIQPCTTPSRDEILAARMVRAREYLAELETREGADQSPEIQAYVSSLSDDRARRVLAQILYEKFVQDLLEADESMFQSHSHQPQQSADGMPVEVMFAVGTEDGVDRDSLVEFLMASGAVTADDLAKVRVIRRRSFVELAPDTAYKLIEALRSESLAGRQLRPAIAEQNGRTGGPRRGGDRGDRGDRPFRGGDRRPRFGGDREDRGERRDRGDRPDFRGGDRGDRGDRGGERRFGGRPHGGNRFGNRSERPQF